MVRINNTHPPHIVGRGYAVSVSCRGHVHPRKHDLWCVQLVDEAAPHSSGRRHEKPRYTADEVSAGGVVAVASFYLDVCGTPRRRCWRVYSRGVTLQSIHLCVPCVLPVCISTTPLPLYCHIPEGILNRRVMPQELSANLETPRLVASPNNYE